MSAELTSCGRSEGDNPKYQKYASSRMCSSHAVTRDMMAAAEQEHLHGVAKGGPHGLGDPDDRNLRRVEIDILIPKIMRDRARTEKCTDIVKAFEVCCKDSGISMVYKCRKQNSDLKDCLKQWYENEEFKKIAKEQYLRERTEYRRTGIGKKQREYNATHGV